MVRGTEKSNQNNFPTFRRGEVLSEINLIRNPFCIVSKNHLKPKQSLVYEEVSPEGVKHVWKVKPDIDLGFCGALDKKVLVAIQKLATDQSFPPPRFLPIGSLNEMCRLLRMKAQSLNRKAIKQALLRIGSTTIYTDNFFLKERNEYWEDSLGGGQFTLWNVYWKGKTLPDGTKAQTIYLELNAPFIVSLASYYTVPLDFDYYLELPPMAQRLYELTRLRFFGLKDSPYARFEYPKLCEVMPVKQQRYFSDAQKAFKRAHSVLKETGWFSQVEWQGGPKNKSLVDMPWAVCYYPGPRAKEELARSKERQERFQQIREAESQLLPGEKWARLDLWVNDLAEALENSSNRPFYRLLAYLMGAGEISEQLVYRLLSEAKHLSHEGKIKTTKSAWFTSELKRSLYNKGKNFKTLLAKAKQDLDGYNPN